MNKRDVVHYDRLLKAWSHYVRDGRTFPNALAYPSATVESRLMDGTTGSAPPRGSKVPLHFKDDREVELLDRKMGKMPDDLKLIVARKYLERRSIRQIAAVENISTGMVHKQVSMAVAWCCGAMA